jgi:uncharacterized protein
MQTDYINFTLTGILLTILLFVAGACTPDQQQRTAEPAASSDRLQVLFLGDDRGHEPSVRLRDIGRPMLDRGIELHYTSDLADINLENLQKYDAVLHYANYHEPHYPQTDPQMIADLIQYVEEGRRICPGPLGLRKFP